MRKSRFTEHQVVRILNSWVGQKIRVDWGLKQKRLK